MRRTGKTTRLIDKAVQMLFDDGEITILTNKEAFGKSNEWSRGLSKKQIESRLILVDDAADVSNSVQRNFHDRLRKRLYMEHGGCFIEAGNTFKVISD